jgi:DNA helicase-2/ATP-dependent DNA helicase PcrA
MPWPISASCQPDDDLAFERIVNTPKRGLGDKAQQTIQRAARDQWREPGRGRAALLGGPGLGGKGKAAREVAAGARRHRALGHRWRSDGQGDHHVELAEIDPRRVGLHRDVAERQDARGAGRLENLKELVKALEEFENLQGFLEHVSLIMDNEQEDAAEKVTIMTLHAAKGLEFPAVFLPGWEDGLFPSQRSMDEGG